MDKITQITKYRTTDGKEHATREAAEQHQAMVDLQAQWDADDLRVGYERDGASSEEIAIWLFKHYILTPKK